MESDDILISIIAEYSGNSRVRIFVGKPAVLNRLGAIFSALLVKFWNNTLRRATAASSY
jgi:hypothetical protein